MKLIWKLSFVVAVAAMHLYYTRDTFDPESIVGARVLVTGSSKGIGRALALQYARLGANVFITARNESKLKEVIGELKEVGRKDAVFSYFAADMAKYETEAEVLIKKAVSSLGGLDHVILNHAMMPTATGKIWSGTDDELPTLTKTMDVNFNSFAYLTAFALPHLEASKGHLGVISSIGGKVEAFGAASYCASKFAMDGFFSTLRLEGASMHRPVSITVHNLGVIGTEDLDSHIQKFADAWGVNANEAKAAMFNIAGVDATALAVIKATSRGDRELYFPTFQPLPLTWLPIIRHLVGMDKFMDPSMLNSQKDKILLQTIEK